MKALSLIAFAAAWFTATAHGIVDSNNNGFSDLWEREHNAGELFGPGFLPAQDPDKDGWNNLEEAAAGSDPFDPNPPDGLVRPEIDVTPAVFGTENGQQVVITPEVVTVSWPTIHGKRYRLFVSPDLAHESWIEVPDSEFIGTGSIPEFHFTTNTSDRLFYRIAVDDVDSDNDGVTDAEEAVFGTDAFWWDSDYDGLADLDEVLNGYSPTNADEDTDSTPDGWGDSDTDGYTDLEEVASGTNPRNASLKPDGISTDTLLVRSASISVTRIGARGSKDFAFRELVPIVPLETELGAEHPKYYLGLEESTGWRQEVDFHYTSIYWGPSGVNPDLTELYAHTGANDLRTVQTAHWERGTPSSPNGAAVPYVMQWQEDHLVERNLLYTAKPYLALEPLSTYLSYKTGDPESEDFDFSLYTDGAEDPSAWDEFASKGSILSNDAVQHESTNSVLGYKSYADEIGSFRSSYHRIQTTLTSLSNEYTDELLSSDVDEALADAREAAAGGTSSGISGSASINGRGVADHQWSADHTNHLKMDSKVKLSTTLTQSGVRKVVFLWSEIQRPDSAIAGEAGLEPELHIRRVVKTSASTYSPGSTVDTAEIEVLHPAEPGYIEIPGPSVVDAPDRVQVTPGDHATSPPFPPLAPLHVHSSLTDRGIAVTLENTGASQIRIWKEQDGNFSQVSLPYNLQPEEKTGQTARPASLYIQGLAPGSARLALKAQGQEIAFKIIRVFDLDLDTDSDNTGQIDATTMEDGIEYTAGEPGVIIVPNPDGDEDSDGTPNSDDFDNAGNFTPIRIALANLDPTARVIFRYSAAGLGTEDYYGSLRLWKKNGTTARSSTDLLESGGQGYTAAMLGVSGGGTGNFYLEAVSDLGGAQSVSIEAAGATDVVKIFPLSVQTVSRDKYLAGSFEIPAGWDDLTAEFVNTSSLENLGAYTDLSGGGTTKIYDSVDEIMGEEDMLSGSQPATQRVWFVRSSGNARKLDFYTCFNSVGTVEIRLSRGGQTVVTRSHQLTTADDFAETIRYVDDWVKGNGFELSGGGGTLPLGIPMALNGTGQGGGLDNLTRAALIPFFNVINQVEGLASAATGLFDGARAGINDDWQFLLLVKSGIALGGDWAWQQVEQELVLWRDDPVKRAGELKKMAMGVCEDWVFKPLKEVRTELSTWDGFKNASWKVWRGVQGTAAKSWTVTRNLWEDIVTGMIEWGDDFCDRMMTGAEKAHWDAVPWERSKLDEDINQYVRQASYTFGYTFGYISEQIAVGVLSAGTVKIAQVTAKGGAHLAANLAKRTAANVAARAHFLKRLLAETTNLPADLVAAYQRGFSIASTGPTGEGMDLCAIHMMQEAADAGRLVWRDYVNGIVGKTNIRQFVEQGGNHIIERQFARLTHILGDEFTEQLGKNFLKIADEFILVKQVDETVDDFFEAFFKAFEGNPSLVKHADEVAIRTGGGLEPLSPNAKARLKQFLSDPNAGDPWKLDVPEDFPDDAQFPIPGNYWARGLLIELQQFKKIYKSQGYDHFPTATAYDYKGPKYVQMKSVANPTIANAIQRMRKAIDRLATAAGGDDMVLHIVAPNDNFAAMRTALEAYVFDKPYANRIEIIIEKLTFP
jgi:hypothetical protein